MRACPNSAAWQQFLADELAPSVVEAMTAHLDGCSACQGTLDRLVAGAEPDWSLLQRSERPSAAEQACLSALLLKSPAETIAAGTPMPVTLPTAPEPFPGYELIAELGRGGMGVVYRARQVRLNRMVALKMLLEGALADPARRARFRTEAEAAAQLQHPHIIQIYEVGEYNHCAYFAMELATDGHLGEHLQGQPQPPETAARVLATLARAVDYAHQKGIIHRDLKPANILLSFSREPRASALARGSRLNEGIPKIADFGLAKRLTDVDQTRTGVLLGTPCYMAPEQVTRDCRVSPATDVYALGVILYEMLTGRLPFQSDDLADMLAQVRKHEPAPLRRLQRQVPRDLETICLKCLHKAPDKRYTSAAALATDLERFLAGQPIVARRASAAERAWKWLRRHPSTALVVLLGGSLLAALALLLANPAARPRGDEERPVRAESVPPREQADAALRTALAQCEQGEIAAGLLRLAQTLHTVEQAGLADLEPAIRTNLAAWRPWLRQPRLSPPARGPLAALALQPEGDGLIVAGSAGLQRWQTKDWQALAAPETGPVRCVAVDPAGKFLASGGDDGVVQLWPAAGGPAVAELRHGGAVRALDFSPDGTLLATAGAEAGAAGGAVRLWDVARRTPRATWVRLPAPVTAVAFDRDGAAFWTASGRLVQRWRAEDGWPVGPPLRHGDTVLSLALSPDKPLLATGSANQTIRCIDVRSGKAASEDLPAPGPVAALAFCPGSFVLAAAGGRAGQAGFLQLWDVRVGQRIAPPQGEPAPVTAVAFDPAGQTVFTAAADGHVRARPALPPETGTPILHQRAPMLHNVTVSLGGRRLIGRLMDGEFLRCWDLAGAGPARPLPFEPIRRIEGMVASPDGQRLAVFDDKAVTFRSAVDGRPLGGELPHGERVRDAVFHPDGTLLATGTHRPGSTVRLWELASGRPLWSDSFADHDVCQVLFNEDGSRLFAIGFLDGPRQVEVRQWDTATGQLLGPPMRQPFGNGPTGIMAYGGGRLATAGGESLRLWDPATGQRFGAEILLDQGWNSILGLALTPDGRLALAATNGSVRLYDTATQLPVGRPWWHPQSVDEVLLIDNGQVALSLAIREGVLRRWQVPRPVPGPAERVMVWIEALTGMRLDPAGTPRLLTEGELAQLRARLEALGGPPIP